MDDQNPPKQPVHNEVSAGDAIDPIRDVANRTVAYERNVAETIGPVTDQVHRMVTHIEIKKDWRFLLVLAVLIIVPPPATWAVGLLGTAWGYAGIVVGWLVGLAAVWVGYKGLAKETTVDHA